MCGIGGAVALRAGALVDQGRLRGMAEAMRHRGPDDQGVWIHPRGQVGLVHRRLSIIDLVTGRQPMSVGDDAGVIVFNGEIYNYRELRKGLVDEGATFRTESDTEVLLQAYRRRGVECLEGLRGMFAFALWDESSQSLFLARDRVGKKPLFYAVEGDCLYFASTLQALRAGSRVPGEMDLAALDHFLDLGYVPSPECIWKGIAKLPAAHYMVVDSEGIHRKRFWNLNSHKDPFQGDFEDAVDSLDELLNDAVSIRLRSDVPLGVFLSGGIDSSLVTAVAARQADSRIETFSIGFQESVFDESSYARMVAEKLGTLHHPFLGTRRMLDLLPHLVRHFGEPFGDSSSLNVWLLAEETRKHVTVALGGDGGDEGFAGYNWYRTFPRIEKWRRRLTPGGAALTLKILEAVPVSPPFLARMRRALRVIEVPPAKRFGKQRTFLGRDERGYLYAGELERVRGEGDHIAEEWIAALYEGSSGSSLHRMRSADISSYLADCLMPKVDVATMAHGLEARAPLLDHTILEFARTLPDSWLTDRSHGKVILRAVLDRYLPKELFERPKMGFSVPLADWFASAGQEEIAGRLTENSRLLDTGWFQKGGVLRLFDEHRRGVRDHSQRLYNLLVLDEWLGQNG